MGSLGKLWNLSGDVATVQETHFTCTADCRVLKNNSVVYSAFGNRCRVGLSLLVVFAGNGGRLVVIDIAVKSFVFRGIVIYMPNCAVERHFFRQRVRIPVALLRSLSDKYSWERYEPSYPPTYGLNSTTTVFLKKDGFGIK